MNLDLQRDGRVLPFPFPFLDSNKAMNVRPLNYNWPEFYRLSLGLLQHAWSGRAVWRRLQANRGFTAKALNLIRAISTGRIKYHAKILELLESHSGLRGYFEGDHQTLPRFYGDQIQQRLGALHEWLPTEAVNHDIYAYLKSEPSLAA